MKRIFVTLLLAIVSASLLASYAAPALATVRPYSTFTMIVNTDRELYDQGDQVTIAGTLMAGSSPVPSVPVSVQVTKPSNAMIFVDMPNTDSTGQFTTAFTLPQGAALGQYTVTVACQDTTAQTFFEVQGVTTTTTTISSSTSTTSTTSTGTSSTTSSATYTFTASSITGSTTFARTTASTTAIPEFQCTWPILIAGLLAALLTIRTHRREEEKNSTRQ